MYRGVRIAPVLLACFCLAWPLAALAGEDPETGETPGSPQTPSSTAPDGAAKEPKPVPVTSYTLQIVDEVNGDLFVEFTYEIAGAPKPGQLMLSHESVSGFKVKIAVTPLRLVRLKPGASETTFLSWRSETAAPVEGWDNVEMRFRKSFAYVVSSATVTEPEPFSTDSPAPPPDPAIRPMTEAEARAFRIGELGGLDGEISSEQIEKLDKVTSVLYAAAPNEFTAVAAMFGDGLRKIDAIGGHSGVRIMSAWPFANLTVLRPVSFEKAKENIKRVIVDEAKKQLLGTLSEPVAKALPHLKQDIAKVEKALKQAQADLKEAKKKAEAEAKRIADDAKRLAKKVEAELERKRREAEDLARKAECRKRKILGQKRC